MNHKPDGEFLKTLVVSPGQRLLFITKHDVSSSQMQEFADRINEWAGDSIPILVVNGHEIEVAVLDDRTIAGYVPPEHE